MSIRWNTPPLRIAGTYFVASAIYIIVSDWLVEAEVWSNWLPSFQTIKGLIFVCLSSFLIYILSERELRSRRTTEHQLMRAQHMEAVGQLVNGVAHDFNNFLTVIFGNLELIQEDATTNSNLHRQAENAMIAAQRGADLTRRLLAFSRGQSLEPRYIDISDCMTQMKMLLDCVLGEEITVEEEHGPELPEILVDQGQLESALLNLGLNARDAMPNGGTIVLAAKVVSLSDEFKSGAWTVPKGDYVMIVVKDDGQGMPQHVQDRLLEPFFTTKSASQGTGLGFPMAHRFVKQSGGHVVVTSEVGHGTNVSLYFPISAQETSYLSSASAKTDDRFGNETVLLVDNDAAVREVLQTFLTRLGYHVLLASCAKEARDLLTDLDQVDLLLTDIVLGSDQNGIALANLICHERPSLPVLLMSGIADAAMTGDICTSAPVGWIDKPFNRKQVAQRLRELLDG